MLKNIPAVLSSDLLKVLDDMGHADCICIGDGNFPGSSLSKKCNAVYLKADGIGVPELLDAILQLIPLDANCDNPVYLMELSDFDKELKIDIWNDYQKILEKYDNRGIKVIRKLERQEFYDKAASSYCILETGEKAIYASIILRKGVV